MYIRIQIEELILKDLNKQNPKSEDDVWKYRDSNFLNGSYDYLFLTFIKDKKLF